LGLKISWDLEETLLKEGVNNGMGQVNLGPHWEKRGPFSSKIWVSLREKFGLFRTGLFFNVSLGKDEGFGEEFFFKIPNLVNDVGGFSKGWGQKLTPLKGYWCLENWF